MSESVVVNNKAAIDKTIYPTDKLIIYVLLVYNTIYKYFWFKLNDVITNIQNIIVKQKNIIIGYIKNDLLIVSHGMFVCSLSIFTPFVQIWGDL